MREKFKITCLICGSNNVHIEEEIDYDWDEMPYTSGYFLKCQDCGSDNCNNDDYYDEDYED